MTIRSCSVLLIMLITIIISGPALSRNGKLPKGFRGDFLSQLNAVEDQITDLEQAIPQGKYTWRPGEGVRSIGEVYLHIAFGNYMILKLAGYDPPARLKFDMDMKKWEAQTMEKSAILSVLKESFDHVRSTIRNIREGDLDKKVKMFGQEMTVRAAIMSLSNHIHEHLGQSIAYARTNNVVPPWTARELEKAKGNK